VTGPVLFKLFSETILVEDLILARADPAMLSLPSTSSAEFSCYAPPSYGYSVS